MSQTVSEALREHIGFLIHGIRRFLASLGYLFATKLDGRVVDDLVEHGPLIALKYILSSDGVFTRVSLELGSPSL